MRTQKVLPLVYDNALSYFEQICYLIDKIKETIKYIDDCYAEISKEYKAYTDDKTSAIVIRVLNDEGIFNSKFRELEKSLIDGLEHVELSNSDSYNNLLKAFENLKTELYNELSELQSHILMMYMKFNDLQDYNEVQIEKLSKDLKRFINKQISSKNGDFILVKNPIRHLYDTLNNVLADIVNGFMAIGGMSAGDYDKCLITAGNYDSLKLMSSDYDIKGYFKLFDYIYLIPFEKRIVDNFENSLTILENELKELIHKNTTMRSPFTGDVVNVVDVVNRLTDLHKNGITALEYENYQCTALSYDYDNSSAFYYDWNGKI